MEGLLPELVKQILIFGSLFFVPYYFSKNNFNKKLRANFKEIAKEFNFSYFSQNRNVLNIIAPPSLSGMWKERAIDFTTGSYMNSYFKISMVAGNKSETFVIQPKKEWISPMDKAQLVQTDNKEMDNYFQIKGANSDFIQAVFNNELANYFVLHHARIQHSIEIIPHSINAIINLNTKREAMEDGSLEDDIKFMMDLMDKIANRMETIAYRSKRITTRTTTFL